jgi:hypothetical protein
MAPPEHEWVDEAAGPVVRPYAVTGGRTRHTGSDFDLIAIIESADVLPPDTLVLGPELITIVEICRSSLSVAEVASELDLPVGIVRVLLGDLLDHGLIVVRRPSPVAQFPNERILKDVIDGLHAL